MIDARGVQRLLERQYGLAETATTVGDKSVEALQRESRLTVDARNALAALYREESLRRAMLHAAAGLVVCRVLEGQVTDDPARAKLEFYRVRFRSLLDGARADLQKEFPEGNLALQ